MNYSLTTTQTPDLNIQLQLVDDLSDEELCDYVTSLSLQYLHELKI